MVLSYCGVGWSIIGNPGMIHAVGMKCIMPRLLRMGLVCSVEVWHFLVLLPYFLYLYPYFVYASSGGSSEKKKIKWGE